MSRSILDYKDIESISNAEGGFNYYLYVATDGSGAIMRATTAMTSFAYYIFAINKDDAWSNRTTHTYQSPAAMPDNY